MPAQYLTYATEKSADNALRNGILDHWASDQFRKLNQDDVVWIVTCKDSYLILLGRLEVDRVTTQEQAEREFDVDFDLWEAEWHAIARAAEPARRVNITDVALRLRFDSKTRRRLPRKFSGKNFQRMRRLTEQSAHLLERQWYGATSTLSPDGPITPEIAKIASTIDEEGYYDPRSEDTRNRVLREIVQRRGQADFRRKLLKAYGRKCAISGCDAEAALEAAHITGYLGGDSNRVSNGLLLRADLHTLFDLDLIAVNPKDTTVAIAEPLVGTVYDNLAGTQLRKPTRRQWRPNEDVLRLRWKVFAGR